MINGIKELGKGIAKTFLPKSLENLFGLDNPKSTATPQKVQPKVLPKATPKPTKQQTQEALGSLDPAQLKVELKQHLKDNIKSGVLDRGALKSKAESFVKSKVNERIIQNIVPKQPKTVSGFMENLKGDAVEMVDGFGAMIGMGLKAVANPIETLKNIGSAEVKLLTSPAYRQQVKNTFVKPIIDDYKEYRDPLTKAYEDPLSVALDVSTLLSFAGKGVQVAGKSAQLSKVAKTGEVIQEIATPFKFSNISKATKKVISALPRGDELVRNWELAAQTRQTLQKEQVAFLSQRDKILNEVDKRVNAMSAEEASILPKVAEGFIGVPEDASKEFREALGMVRALGDDQARFGLSTGGLSSEIIERRKFQPLAKFLEREGMIGQRADIVDPLMVEARKYKSAEEFVKAQGEQVFRGGNKSFDKTLIGEDGVFVTPSKFMAETFGKNVDELYISPKARILSYDDLPSSIKAIDSWDEYSKAVSKYGREKGVDVIDSLPPKADFPRGMERTVLNPEVIQTKSQLTDIWKKASQLKVSTVPYENLTGPELTGYINKIKEFFPEADPVYMRHFFEDDPKKFSGFFLNTAPVRSFKPGFMKKSYGKEGYIGSSAVSKEQLKSVLERQASENLKWQRNMKLIEDFKNHPEVKVLKKGEKPIEGYEVFAPDGFLRFYKGSIDFSGELKKAIEASGDDVSDLFGDVADKLFTKDYIGVTKAKLYQMPSAMAKEVKKITAATNPYIKLFYDKPLDAFRFLGLSLYPRWLVNNVIGNAIFSTISGDVFNPKSFYIYNQAKKIDGLLPDELFGGVHRVEKTTSGRLGQAADIPWIRSTVALHDRLLNTKVVGHVLNGIEKSIKWGVYKPLKTVGDTSFKINKYVDDMFKGSSYITKALREDRKSFIKRMTMGFEDSLATLEKTNLNLQTKEKILDSVNKWYYSGLNLTNFERRVVRRVVPFYSWMRWASLYAYHIATEAPVRANIIANMSRDFYGLTGQNQLPLNLRGSVPIGTDEDGTVYYLKTSGVNIFGHFNDLLAGDGLLGGAFNLALKSSAPLVKTAAEQATGRDIFLDRPFTREDIHEAMNGQLWKFDPETGEVREVEGKVKPALTENLLRNYIPQYLLMETILTGGQKRYTAEGLTTILFDLIKDPKERNAIIKDVITKQGSAKTTYGLEFYKALGINMTDITAEDRVMQTEAKQRAVSALKNQLAPILNESFKSNLKKRVMQEVAKGTPPDMIEQKVKGWIMDAITDIENLSKLGESEKPKQN